MAHRALWLTACGAVLLCVAVTHVSGHPTFDKSPHEEMPPHQMMMPYYPQAQPPQQYYPPYEGEDEGEEEEEEEPSKDKINLRDFEPVLADTALAYLQNVFIDPLNAGASPLDYLRKIWTTRPEPVTLPSKPVIYAVRGWLISLLVGGFIFTIYVIIVPIVYQLEEEMVLLGGDDSDDDGRSLTETNGFMGRLVQSLDFFEDYMLEMPAEERCREQMICEMRYLMTYVTPLEELIRTYGMRVPGLRQGYQKALDDGSSRRPCKTSQKEECSNSVLSILLSVAKAITGEHY